MLKLLLGTMHAYLFKYAPLWCCVLHYAVKEQNEVSCPCSLLITVTLV